MKNLIPHFIHTQYKKNSFEGDFDAFSMFIDISGFTKMTEALMQHEEEGAEILSELLNEIFNPVVNAVYESGGFITTFAGDAFTAIFPVETDSVNPLQILACAKDIQHIFDEIGYRKTKLGDFHIGVKIGISAGDVSWGIVGKEGKAYFFRGDAVVNCAVCEHHAEQGDIVFDENFLVRQRKIPVKFEKITTGFYKTMTIKKPPENRVIAVDAGDNSKLTREVIKRFLPDSVIDFYQRGEFRNCAPIFISFTGIESKTELDEFVSILIENERRYSGYLNKLDFGDKGNVAIVIFGAPVAYEDNIERALSFILNVESEINASETLGNLKYRTGITYGKVYAGIVGGDKRCEYTVLGDIVNLSARFMMKADWGNVWISSIIYGYTQNYYMYESIGKFRFKGKSGEIQVYQLTGKMREKREEFTGKFVGRSKEIQLAEKRFEPLNAGNSGGMIYIYGQAGVGKSRFIYELKQKKSDYHWLYLSCDGIQRKSLNPFESFFKEFFNQATKNNPEQNRQNFDIRYNNLIESSKKLDDSEIKSELIRLRSIMEGFLGIHDRSVDSLYNQLEPRLRHENTLHAFKEIFKLLSLSAPIAIEIEDLQWMDEDSMKAFQFICRNIESFPIIFVISSRYYDDESKPKIPVETPSLEIDLQVLSDEGTIEFAESLLDGKLSDKLKENLLGKTEGNPFFVEQTVFFYRESDIIYFDSARQHWEMKEDTKAIPDTINDLIIARIDRLSAKLKEAVQTASVFGQEFDINLLMEVLDKISQVWEESDYQYFLKEGEDIKVWAILSQIKGIFAHAIMRDAVYNMQLRSRLRTLHQIVAETLRNLFPDDKRTYADLAFHYEQAGMREQTKEFLEKAAFYAKEDFKNHEAAKFFGKVCRMYEEDLGLEEKEIPESQLSEKDQSKLEKYIDLQIYHGTVLSVLGQLTKANENFRFALNIAEAIKDETRAGKLNLNLGSNSLYFGKFDQALTHFGKAKSIFDGNNDYEYLAIVMGNIGLINLYQGNLGDAIDNFQKELSLSQKANDKPQEVIAVGHMGNAYDLMGYYDNAIKYFRKQLDMSREIKHKFLEASALGDIGVAHYYKGDYEKAISYYEKQLKLNREIGNNLELSNAIGNMGLVYSDRGEFDKALDCYEQKLYLSKELADKKEMSIVYNNMAEVYIQKGNYEKGISVLDKAINIGKELNHDYFLSNFILSKAEALFEFGKLEEAEKVCQKGYKLGKKVNRKDVIFRATVLLLKIDFVLHEKSQSVRKVSKLLDEISKKEDQAVLNYELYNMTKEQNYKNEALSLYQKLYEKTPKFVYQKRIKELKGETQ